MWVRRDARGRDGDRRAGRGTAARRGGEHGSDERGHPCRPPTKGDTHGRAMLGHGSALRRPYGSTCTRSSSARSTGPIPVEELVSGGGRQGVVHGPEVVWGAAAAGT